MSRKIQPLLTGTGLALLLLAGLTAVAQEVKPPPAVRPPIDVIQPPPAFQPPAGGAFAGSPLAGPPAFPGMTQGREYKEIHITYGIGVPEKERTQVLKNATYKGGDAATNYRFLIFETKGEAGAEALHINASQIVSLRLVGPAKTSTPGFPGIPPVPTPPPLPRGP